MEKSLVEITSHGIWTECCKCNKGYTDGLAEQELEELFSIFSLLSQFFALIIDSMKYF